LKHNNNNRNGAPSPSTGEPPGTDEIGNHTFYLHHLHTMNTTEDFTNDNTPEEINLKEYAAEQCSEEAAEIVNDAFGADAEKIVALALHLEIDFEDAQNILVPSYDNCLLEYGSQEYLVCTDSEADEKWDAELENYIDECILPEIPNAYRNYFDNDAWKSDAMHDGRGHALNRYNGSEDEQTVNGTTFYIYRQN